MVNLSKILILLFIVFNSQILKAEQLIVYVNLDYVMNNSLAGKSIQKQLNKKNDANIQKFSKIEKNLKIEETKLISQKNILEKNDYQKKIELFSKKVLLYKTDRAKIIKNLAIKKNKAQSTLVNALNPILANYSKEKSISLILPKKNIVIGKTDLDITKIILVLLDKNIKSIKLE